MLKIPKNFGSRPNGGNRPGGPRSPTGFYTYSRLVEFDMVPAMNQRGRKSSASLVVVATGAPPRLAPPADLSDDEKALFLELVNACSPKHFVESDKPLLISFIQATILARASAGKAMLIGTWEKAVKVQALLATRLRLAPQARLDPQTVGRFKLSSGLPKPWELGKDAKDIK
jgi:hypothetical protein